MSTTTYSAYDPAPYYLRYNNQPSSTYYSYYLFSPFFDFMQMPVPNIADTSHAIYLQYWSSIFESPILKAGLLFLVSNTIVFGLLAVYFIFTWLKSDGFTGFEWNLDPKNIDAVTTAMTW